MKKCMSFLMMIFVSTSAFATTRAELMGSSQKEREIRWVWKYLREFTQSCYDSGAECQDPILKKAAADLNAYLPYFDDPEIQKWNELLEFTSEKTNPELFKSDQGETHRLAVTELNKFSKVYINTDRMNLPNQNWVGVLAHEALHHLGAIDDDSRLPDRIGAEIAAHFQKRSQTIILDQYKREDLTNLVFNSKAARASVGFLSWQQHSFDVDWTHDTLLQSLCGANEKITKEFVGSPSWRLNRLSAKSGRVTVRGGGFVNVECTNKLRSQSGQTRFDRSRD